MLTKSQSFASYTLEKYGLINCDFDTVEMHEFMDKYTARVGKFELIALAKAKKR